MRPLRNLWRIVERRKGAFQENHPRSVASGSLSSPVLEICVMPALLSSRRTCLSGLERLQSGPMVFGGGCDTREWGFRPADTEYSRSAGLLRTHLNVIHRYGAARRLNRCRVELARLQRPPFSDWVCRTAHMIGKRLEASFLPSMGTSRETSKPAAACTSARILSLPSSAFRLGCITTRARETADGHTPSAAAGRWSAVGGRRSQWSRMEFKSPLLPVFAHVSGALRHV
jgi:hypothetical protein